MDHLSVAFAIFQRNIWLWLVPLCLNFLEMFLKLYNDTLSFVTNFPTFKIPFPPNGICYINNILVGTNKFSLSPEFFLLIFIIPFFLGGYIGSIFKLLNGDIVSFLSFWKDCYHYYFRTLAIIIQTFIISLVIAIPANFIPVLTLIAPFIVAYITYFWKFAMIKDDSDITTAMIKGRCLIRYNLGEFCLFFLALSGLAALLSIPINFLAQDIVGYILAIVFWTYMGSIISIAMMDKYCKLCQNFNFL